MKLAFISHRVHRAAGPARYAAELIDGLNADNETTVFSFDFEQSAISKARFFSVPTLPKSWLATYLSFAISHSVLILFLRHFRSQSFDIIHASGVDSPFLANVITVHFCEREGLAMEEAGLHRSPAGAFGQWLKAKDYHLYRHLTAFVERFIMKHRESCSIIAISEANRRELIRHYGKDAERAIVIPHGVDTKTFHPENRERHREQVLAELGLDSDDLIILFVGGDWERKGLPHLLTAVAGMPNKDAKLVVVGTGDEPHYRAIIRQQGLADRTVFTGGRSDVHRFYGAADVFVLPTLYDPFGLVIMEAMSSGLPVITNRAAGAAAFIQDGVSGLLLEDPSDTVVLAQKIAWLLEDGQRRLEMGRRARQAVEDMTWTAVIERTLAVYKDTLHAQTNRNLETTLEVG